VQRVVVVGAGLAGCRAAAEAVARGVPEVVLLGAEPHPPYDRPPLSKAVLSGGDPVPLDVDLAGVDVRLGVTATGLRPGVVETSAGDVAWGGLVLATGARAVLPPALAAPGVHVLRSLDDALALRAALVPGARVVVVGAGWIGAEVATAAASAGCTVTVLEAAEHPLAGALGEVGALTVPWYAEAGVDLRLATPVRAVRPGVVVADDGELPADVVVVGVGATPDTGWLEGSGLALDRGVVVDEHLSASWPVVVAVGDCTARWSPREGARVRVEHWDDALHGPTAAVATLLGEPTVHDPVPYFWSEQLGHRLQLVGHPSGEVLRRPDGSGVGWLRDGVLRAWLAVDRPRDLAQARKRVGTPVVAVRLADPALALREV
jgi:NADPH-dependent 2,4-dienoyl-CoA reductase/sulfur reductase-like enzyme